MRNKFYITTPIYYVNAAPHIGHSYTSIAADALARYYRQTLGENNVWFLTGTDEHGQKIQRAADEAKILPQEFVDKVSVQFKGLWQKLNISYNDFIRTTEQRHIQVVQKVLDIVYRYGDIYKDSYEGWYCTPCETFWPQTQLVNGVCPDCQRPVEKIKEENYFFKLGKYQDELIRHIESHKNFILPEFRRNEVLSFLKLNKLEDLCISRPKERLGWGIPLPFSADHVTYVWFDALINYLSGAGSMDDKGNFNSSWWQADSEVVHLIGKDILRQHAVYWPIMLISLQNAGVKGIKLPDTVFAHGWWMSDSAKMSKSRGNVVNPLDMVDKYGIDTYRYFLLSDIPFGNDGNFSEEAIIKRFNGDLANDLGNLVYRTLTMVEKYYQGEIPRMKRDAVKDANRKVIIERIEELSSTVNDALSDEEAFNFNAALSAIWGLIGLANKHVEEAKPWNLAKENKPDELKEFIFCLVEVLRAVADKLSSFMPQTSQAIKKQIGEDRIFKDKPLFPRIETK